MAPTRTLLRAALAAPLSLAVIASAALPAAAAAAPHQRAHTEVVARQAAGGLGAGWVGRHLTADGYIPGFGGAPSFGSTAYAAIALASSGHGKTAMDSAESWLAGHTQATADDAAKPGNIAIAALAAHAAHDDARAGTLADRLLAVEQGGPEGSGPKALNAKPRPCCPPDFGFYGSPAAANYPSAFTQSLGVLAAQAAGRTVGESSGWLLRQQCADGGWQPYLDTSGTGAACTPPDAANFVGEDTNDTALAVQALEASNHLLTTGGYADPKPFLHSAQNSDGGFGLYPGSASDPNSTAVVVQALTALGEDVSNSGGGWAKKGTTALDYLLSLQIGCTGAQSDQGGFPSPYSAGAADALATVQIVPALEGATQVTVADSGQATDLPALDCPVTQSPTPTATEVPTQLPTELPTVLPVPSTSTSATDPAVPDEKGVALADFTHLTQGALAVTQGQVIHVVASGFKPDSDVHMTLHSVPVDLGDVTASKTGRLDTHVTIPATFSLGAHSLVLTGLAADGTARVLTRAVVVSPASALPLTGDDGRAVAHVAIVGAGLLLLGVCLFALVGIRPRGLTTAVGGNHLRQRS